jgi:hypothetical protein
MDQVSSLARTTRWVAALLLVGLAAVFVVTALRERDLAQALNSLKMLPGREAESLGTPYVVASWAHLCLAAAQTVIAIVLVRAGDRIWFGLAALTCGLSAASGVWARVSVATAHSPVQLGGVLPLALMVMGGLGLLTSITGWIASPPLVPVKPSVQIVSNHQA